MGRLPGSWDPPAWSGPWKGLLLAASVLSSCLQPVPAQTPTPTPVTITPASPALGGNVSLAPQNVAQNFTSCNWHRSTTNDETSRILTYFPPPNPVQHNGPAHTGRETAGPGCALHIAGLTLSDTGNYTTLAPIPHGGAGTRSNALSVPCTEMLPRPTVTPNQTLVLENGTFTLRCNSSPSADTVLWLRDGASLTPSERLVLSPDNRTLTVLGVTRSDGGTYQCEVGNPVSTNRSEPSTVTGGIRELLMQGSLTGTVLSLDPLSLCVDGPASVRIDPPGPITLTLGSPLTLTCVADSVPVPSYCWGLNGTDTNQTGSSLTFNPMTLDHQGTYECWAHNPITNRTVLVSVTARFVGESLGSNLALAPCPPPENALLGSRCRWGWGGAGPCMEPGWGVVGWPGRGLTMALGGSLGDVSGYGPSSVEPGAEGLDWGSLGVCLPHGWADSIVAGGQGICQCTVQPHGVPNPPDTSQ
uniref:Ig-like domain-containing protein n=1 Tax=Chelonoidis abingdonii TaxID=106734 RepID=A0A8C0GC18_CHEAB